MLKDREWVLTVAEGMTLGYLRELLVKQYKLDLNIAE